MERKKDIVGRSNMSRNTLRTKKTNNNNNTTLKDLTKSFLFAKFQHKQILL